MHKVLIAMVTGICLSLFSFLSVSYAQTNSVSGLTEKQQSIATIAAFTSIGKLDKLSIALNEGLDNGLTINEIKEVLVQMYAYAGFPRSLNGITTFMKVLETREAKGIHDTVGRDASPLPTDKTSLELGAEVQTQLMGGPSKALYNAFAPAIDQFLKGHLFGDIFGRDILDFQSREIATIAALATMPGLAPQLHGHLNVGLNTGLTEFQLKSLIAVIATKVGKDEAATATKVLSVVLSNRTR